MNQTIRSLVSSAAALAALVSFTPAAGAAKVTLDGSGSYSLSGKWKYYRQGTKQSGRYLNLGEDYYRQASIRMQFITNRSRSTSGSISFELWALRYYGATSGIVLMTRGADPLRGGYYYTNRTFSGHSVFLDEVRYPELSLWEFTNRKWIFRDALSFRYRDLL